MLRIPSLRCQAKHRYVPIQVQSSLARLGTFLPCEWLQKEAAAGLKPSRAVL